MLLASTPITIGSGAHVLHGQLALAGNRIQERLNDVQSNVLKLSDVQVHARWNSKCVARLESALVPKSQIEYVLVNSTQHEAPTKRWNNHTRKINHAATVVLSTCCIEGEVHLSDQQADARSSIIHQLPPFFALTNASVRSLGEEALDVPLAFASREQVGCLSVGDLAAQDLAQLMKPPAGAALSC